MATETTSHGVNIGTDVQAEDAALTSISGLTTAVDKMIYTTGSDTYAVTDLTSTGRGILAGTTKVTPFTDSLFAVGNISTTSATFVDMVNSSKSVSFATGTQKILMNANISIFTSIASTEFAIRAVIQSTNSEESDFFINTVNEHNSVSRSFIFSGPFSGSQTVKLQIRRLGGTGTITQNSDDAINWTILGFS